jgi:hypothetical protein
VDSYGIHFVWNDDMYYMRSPANSDSDQREAVLECEGGITLMIMLIGGYKIGSIAFLIAGTILFTISNLIKDGIGSMR